MADHLVQAITRDKNGVLGEPDALKKPMSNWTGNNVHYWAKNYAPLSKSSLDILENDDVNGETLSELD